MMTAKIALFGLVVFLLVSLLASAPWCVEQWGFSQPAAQCLIVENIAFGQWFTPAGFGVPSG